MPFLIFDFGFSIHSLKCFEPNYWSSTSVVFRVKAFLHWTRAIVDSDWPSHLIKAVVKHTLFASIGGPICSVIGTRCSRLLQTNFRDQLWFQEITSRAENALIYNSGFQFYTIGNMLWATIRLKRINAGRPGRGFSRRKSLQLIVLYNAIHGKKWLLAVSIKRLGNLSFRLFAVDPQIFDGK